MEKQIFMQGSSNSFSGKICPFLKDAHQVTNIFLEKMHVVVSLQPQHHQTRP